MRATGIFTGTTSSPCHSLRQSHFRYAIRAGRNLPDKEFRYLRTVIVTAAVHWGFSSKLLPPISSPGFSEFVFSDDPTLNHTVSDHARADEHQLPKRKLRNKLIANQDCVSDERRLFASDSLRIQHKVVWFGGGSAHIDKTCASPEPQMGGITSPFNLPAPGRRQPLYVVFDLAETCVFVKQSQCAFRCGVFGLAL